MNGDGVHHSDELPEMPSAPIGGEYGGYYPYADDEFLPLGDVTSSHGGQVFLSRQARLRQGLPSTSGSICLHGYPREREPLGVFPLAGACRQCVNGTPPEAPASKNKESVRTPRSHRFPSRGKRAIPISVFSIAHVLRLG